MDKFSVTIPVKKHIRKYFTVIYGESISLNLNNEFDRIILTMLTSAPVVHVSRNFVEKSLFKTDDKLKFFLPIDLFYRYDFSKIPMENKYQASRFLEKNFKTNLYLNILLNKAQGVYPLVSTKLFLSKYEIDEDYDIDPESLARAFRRDRHYIEKYFSGALSTIHGLEKIA